VLGSDQPQCLPELMSYRYEMASFARKYKWPAWVVYNMNYRQEAANRTLVSWAEIVGHQEAKFFSQCFNGMAKDPNDAWCRTCQSLDHSTSGCPLMPHSQQSRREAYAPQPVICRNYNTKGCVHGGCLCHHISMNCGVLALSQWQQNAPSRVWMSRSVVNTIDLELVHHSDTLVTFVSLIRIQSQACTS